jgi:hypothetical protein
LVRPPPNIWPHTNGSRGVLFLAQLLSEMLTPTTFESFRAFSLDTNARLREALELADDVRRSRIPQPALRPVIEELLWSFSKDSACRALAPAEIESLRSVVKGKTDFPLDAFQSHLKLLIKLISPNYKTKLEELILDIFADSKQKIEIRKLIGFYCSHIINLGYSRRYILGVVNQFFFGNPIRRIGRSTLQRFFRKFDAKPRWFIVHVSVSDDLSTYLKRHGYQVCQVSELLQERHATLSSNANFMNTPQALETIVDQLDPYDAMDQCYQMLSAHRAIAYLDPYGMEVEWGGTMHVTRLRAETGIAVTKGDFLDVRRPSNRPGSLLRPRSISNYAKRIRKNFDPPSVERLLSSIKTAALARSSGSPENQLISLWSAIEVLLSEPRDQARIVHYASLIAPCITLRHTRRQVFAVYEELLVGYGAGFRRLVRSIPNYKSALMHDAFAEMLFLPEHEQRRQSLLQLLTKNPLALHRVFKIYNDYRDTKCTNRTISDHADRVAWQIHRVYRARNQLVHSGRLPSYLESVILNLAEYYRSAIATIVNHARREDDPSDIDQVVAEIGIRYGIFRDRFDRAGTTPLAPEHVSLLMDVPSM